MSNHSDKNKMPTQDEAFIDALYAKLEAENGNDTPSEFLDQRIISASRKALNTDDRQETSVHQQIPTTNKINKKPIWYVSLASAASFVLVVSLVITQNNEFTVDTDSTMAVPDSIQVDKEFGSVVMVKQRSLAIAQRQQDQQQRQKRIVKSSVRTVKKMEVLSFPDAMVVNKSIEKSLVNENLILTQQQHQSFIKQELYGIFINEQPTFYIVNVLNKADKVIQYQLLKKHFRLKKLDIEVNEQFLFDQFEAVITLK